MTKQQILHHFRTIADTELHRIEPRLSKEKKAERMNRAIAASGNEIISAINQNTNLTQTQKLEKVLLVSYARDIVMLEYRNEVWPYEYMAFSRRIGEIWEPFCKLPFAYASTDLQIIAPPDYRIEKIGLVRSFRDKLDVLSINEDEKADLYQIYRDVWDVLDSGNISLSLDLHFIFNNIRYNVDYKSGFGSNEKGNTNRLLQVGCLYSKLPREHHNLIFVRQPEEENNHYLQTLKNSPYWQVFCANDAYQKIHEFSGFDLQNWMHCNMIWTEDISPRFRQYLQQHNLLRYLEW